MECYLPYFSICHPAALDILLNVHTHSLCDALSSIPHCCIPARLSVIPGINRWNILGAGVSDLAFTAVQHPLPIWRALWTQQLWTLVIKPPVWLITMLASTGPAGSLARLNYSHIDIHSTDCSRLKLLCPGFKKLKKDLLTSRRCRNAADVSSKPLSLFDVPDSAKTNKQKRSNISRSLYIAGPQLSFISHTSLDYELIIGLLQLKLLYFDL